MGLLQALQLRRATALVPCPERLLGNRLARKVAYLDACGPPWRPIPVGHWTRAHLTSAIGAAFTAARHFGTFFCSADLSLNLHIALELTSICAWRALIETIKLNTPFHDDIHFIFAASKKRTFGKKKRKRDKLLRHPQQFHMRAKLLPTQRSYHLHIPRATTSWLVLTHYPPYPPSF